MLKEIIILLIGAFVGVVFSVLFEEQLFQAKKKIRMIFTKIHRKIKPVKIDYRPEAFIFAGKETSVVVIDGNGSAVIHEENLLLKEIADPKCYPKQVFVFKEIFESDLAKPDSDFVGFNGDLWSLYSYEIDRTPNDEKIKLRVALYKTDYYTFQAVTRHLRVPYFDEESKSMSSLYDKYISTFIPSMCGGSVLPNGVGVVANVTTSDRNVIFCKRAEQSGIRPGQWDVSVVEGLNPTRDRKMSVYDVVREAIFEEIGDLPKDKISINVLGLILDKDYNQWNFIAVAKVGLSSEEIREIRQTGAPGKWENERMHFEQLNLRDIVRFLKSHKMWDTALLATYWTLRFREYSAAAINKEIARKI